MNEQDKLLEALARLAELSRDVHVELLHRINSGEPLDEEERDALRQMLVALRRLPSPDDLPA